jgi:hypothetical protein
MARISARSEAYFWVRRNDEGCGVTQHADFLRNRQISFQTFRDDIPVVML